MNEISQAPSGTERSANILQELLEERSQDQYQEKKEVTRFLRATSIRDPIIDPLLWWYVNERCFPLVSNLARNVLAAQESSVACESAFSIAENLITDNRKFLSDNLVRVFMCLNS